MRPTWAEVRLDYIADNFRAIKRMVGADVKVLAALKADAYGHGALPIAARLEQEGIDWIGVALVEEGIKLRDAGIKTPILCLAGFWQQDQAHECVKYDLTPIIYRVDMLDTLATAARSAERRVNYHLKIDTGIGRLGLPQEQLSEFLDQAEHFNQKELKLDGLLTHLASADEMEKTEFTERQCVLFAESLKLVRARGFQPSFHHIANSAGIYSWPAAHGNLVRAGGLLYGFKDTIRPGNVAVPVMPALSLYSKIILLKRVPTGTSLGYGNTFYTNQESLIATLPIGYDDGLRRAYSNNGQVIVRGHYAPIVGRVSMDLTLIDVTDVADVSLGDQVILIGRSTGLEISAEQLGARIGTISYEVTCAITDRVPRFYLQNQALNIDS
jgi:alanine racemase